MKFFLYPQSHWRKESDPELDPDPLVSVGDPDPQDLHVYGPPGSGSISQSYGSGDPDPHQNVADPQHCSQQWSCKMHIRQAKYFRLN
jgi:hypothetical protein